VTSAHAMNRAATMTSTHFPVVVISRSTRGSYHGAPHGRAVSGRRGKWFV
jgi:hypothetical protein